jgi:hypothetical protein
MKRHPLYPEPGAWVLGKTQGLPEINPPEHLDIKNLTSDQVAQIVEYEGLGVCVMGYIPSEKIRDTQLRKRWTKAKQALGEVVDYLDRLPPPPKPKKLKLGKSL